MGPQPGKVASWSIISPILTHRSFDVGSPTCPARCAYKVLSFQKVLARDPAPGIQPGDILVTRGLSQDPAELPSASGRFPVERKHSLAQLCLSVVHRTKGHHVERRLLNNYNSCDPVLGELFQSSIQDRHSSNNTSATSS